MKKGVVWKLLLASALSATMAVAFAACTDNGDDNQGGDAEKYSVTYARGADDATGTIPAVVEYEAGATVTLAAADTFAREGYTFSAWSDGSATYAAGASFTMPANDVTFTAQWTQSAPEIPEGTETIESVPEAQLVTEATVGGNTAKANWFVTYGESSLDFTVYVEDTTPYEGSNIYSSDGVEIVIAKVQRIQGYSDKTISVNVSAAGECAVSNLKTGGAVTDSGITVSANYFTYENTQVDGYKLEISVPYAATEVTAAGKDAAVCLSLTNAVSRINTTTVPDKTYDTDRDNVHTYIAITDNNTFAENPYLELGAVWGNGGDMLKASSAWDITYDDGTDAANITMTRDDNADNYIYMRKSNADKFYAEVQLNVKGFGKNDKWPKFGMTVTTADGEDGFFYYVDAVSDAGNGDAINANSTNVGVATRTAAGAGTYTGYAVIGNLGSGATSADYQGDSYITLGIYRQGGVFNLYANGTLIKTYTCDITSDDEVYVGLASFSLLLNAKGYSFETENLGDYEITTEDVDYLFLGDSYIDTAFWYTYENVFGNLSAANMGVGGTQTAYWMQQLAAVEQLYNPGKIVFHIGVNDVDDGNTSGATVNGRLDELMAAYRKAFPDAQIYWITISDNMMFRNKWEDYKTVNDHMKAKDGITVIDVASAITKDADGDTSNWYGTDGLHFGVNGYAVFDNMICEALGITGRTQTQGGLGDVTVGEAPAFYYTSGWEYDETAQAWHNAGESFQRSGVESQIFVSGAYAADVYAEAKISIKDLYCPTEAWGKAGILVASENRAYLMFINLSTAANPDGKWDDNYGAITYRVAGDSAGWQWREGDFFTVSGNGYVPLGDEPYDYNTDPNAFKTLGVLKYGSDLYFYAGGNLIGNKIASEFAADEKVTVSMFGFNVDMYAKSGSVVTDAEDLAGMVEELETAPLKTIDGDMKDWTEAEKTNPVVIPATEGRSVTVYATMDERGVNVFYDVYHKAYVDNVENDWAQNTNIEFKLGATQYYYNVRKTLQNLEENNVCMITTNPTEEGGLYHTVAEVFVPYNAIGGGSYSANSDYVPAGFAFRTQGENMAITGWTDAKNPDYWFYPDGTPQAPNLMVTKNGFATGTERKIDGDLSDWTEEEFKTASTKTGATAQYKERLGADGLYLAIEIKAVGINITNADASGWHLNTNIEFFRTDNTNAAKAMIFGGTLYHTGFITEAAMKFTAGEDGAEDTLVIEVFIANEHMKNVTSETASVAFDMGGQLYATNVTDTWQEYIRGGHTVARVVAGE